MTHGLRHLLRAGTRELHHQIEAQPAFARILESTASTNDYARFLAAQYSGYCRLLSFECRGLTCHEWQSSEAPDLATCLRQDLRDLDVAWRPDSSPSCLVSRDEFLGINYVIEGSTLGSRVIFRRLSARSWFDRVPARRFLDAMRARARHWPVFVAAMEMHAHNSNEVIAGAKRAFQAFLISDARVH